MTSYVMCNKKKLGIKKSDIDCLKKSVEDRKLEYFKSELLKILDKKEKEESGEEVSKAFIVQELYKSMTDPLYMAKGGKVGVVGEIRTWNGKKYKKMPDKKWVRIYDTHDKHTEISIARLKGKVRNAQSVEELFQIVLNNTHRFSDENGKPLAIVEELKKEVENKRNELAINKELKKPYSKADAVKTIKEWATQDNYDKAKGKTREEIFFNFGQKLKVIGKIPEKYLKILKPSSGDTRVFCGKGYFIDHMVNHHASMPVEDYEIIPDVLENPDKVKIDDSKGVPTLIFQKKTDKYGTVVVNCKTKGDKVIFYKTGFTGNKESYKNKPPVVDRNPTINPSSVGGNGNVSALPDGNSNIAQDYTVVNKNDKENPAVKKSFASIVNELKKSYFDNVGA